MRNDILDYLKRQVPQGFNLATELPWDANNQALYLKNPKKVYVSQPQTSLEPLITVFAGKDILQEVTTISAFFSTDAKQTPNTYNQLIQLLSSVKDLEEIPAIRRQRSVTTEFENDLMITQIEFTFNKLT